MQTRDRTAPVHPAPTFSRIFKSKRSKPPPPTITALPAAYSPSFYVGAAGAAGTSVNVNLAYEIVQQIMSRFGFSANSQAMKADARAVAAFLDITA